MIYESTFKNCKSVVLENDCVKVTVIPKLGGKIASFIKKDSGFELLFQDSAEKFDDLVLYDNFDKAAWGFDDAFPSIESSKVLYNGKEVVYPDHGEIWTLPFDFSVDGDALALRCSSKIFSYNYQKTLSLSGDTLEIKYYIENDIDEPLPFIWTMHCLINCDKDMELEFPEGTDTVEIAIPGSEYLGGVGTIHSFPVTKDSFGNDYRLDRVFDSGAAKKEKYYAKNPVKKGVCSAVYPNQNVKFTTYFDPEKLPFLGFWVTEGGYKGDYNCALEPSSGYFDFIEKARDSQTLCYLKKGEPFEFELKMQLIPFPNKNTDKIN